MPPSTHEIAAAGFAVHVTSRLYLQQVHATIEGPAPNTSHGELQGLWSEH